MRMPIRRMRSRCCARAASGHATAPPRTVMNSRRRIPDTGFPSQSVCRTINLPPTQRRVPVADLNCSEFRGCRLRGEREMTPIWGICNSTCTDPIACKQEAACAIPCTLSDDCDTGAAARRLRSQSIVCLHPLLRHQQTGRASVAALWRFTVGALPFEANQDDSGFLKYARLRASHDCGASK